MSIFHLAEAWCWAAAQATGSYTGSTLGRSLAEEGFIHCSSARQWPVVRQRFYAGHPGPLLLLEIDPTRLAQPPVHEVGDPVTGETFPHLYAALPVAVVVAVTELAPPHGAPSVS